MRKLVVLAIILSFPIAASAQLELKGRQISLYRVPTAPPAGACRDNTITIYANTTTGLQRSVDCASWSGFGLITAANIWTGFNTFGNSGGSGTTSYVGKIQFGATAGQQATIFGQYGPTDPEAAACSSAPSLLLWKSSTSGFGFYTCGVSGLWVRLAQTVGSHNVPVGAAPTLTAGCGTGGAVTGTDHAGRITWGTGGGNSCTLTFATTWTHAPSCMARAEPATAAGALIAGAPSTTAWVLTPKDSTSPTDSFAMTSGDTIAYVCVGF